MTSNRVYSSPRRTTSSFIIVCAVAVAVLAATSIQAAAPWDAHGRLRVTSDGHYLQHEDGTPFFWLADTAWKLRSLSKADIDVYLKDRAAKQFNVVMFNAADPAGRDQPFLGARPLHAVRFNEAWCAHNDYIVDQAARHGLYVVVIAGWGNHFRGLFADMPRGMHEYGRQLGLRYKDRPNVIYFVAGEFYKIRRATSVCRCRRCGPWARAWLWRVRRSSSLI